jgi:hypothetical protein
MRQPPTTAWGLAALVTVVTAILFGIPTLLLAATRHRLATEVPAGYETLGKATSGLTLFNIPHAPTSSTGWTRHELWELVRDLTAKSAGCLPSKIKRDSSWPA